MLSQSQSYFPIYFQFFYEPWLSWDSLEFGCHPIHTDPYVSFCKSFLSWHPPVSWVARDHSSSKSSKCGVFLGVSSRKAAMGGGTESLPPPGHLPGGGGLQRVTPPGGGNLWVGPGRTLPGLKKSLGRSTARDIDPSVITPAQIRSLEDPWHPRARVALFDGKSLTRRTMTWWVPLKLKSNFGSLFGAGVLGGCFFPPSDWWPSLYSPSNQLFSQPLFPPEHPGRLKRQFGQCPPRR